MEVNRHQFNSHGDTETRSLFFSVPLCRRVSFKKIITAIMLSVFISSSTVFAEETPRIVSLSPSLTEIIFQLNRGNCLVGRSSASNYFKKAKHIPIVGDFGAPSIEPLILTKPNIVVSTTLKNPSIQNSLKESGIKFYILPTDNIAKYYKTVRTLGKLLNAEKNANIEIARVKNGLKKCVSLFNKIPETQRLTVFWEICSTPLMTIGNKSFLNDFIYYAGGRNITSKMNKGYFNVSEEWVIKTNPNVIIAPPMGKQKIKETEQRLGWEKTSATKNHRIYGNLDKDLVYILGPRILEAIQAINSCIYPEINKKSIIEKE